MQFIESIAGSGSDKRTLHLRGSSAPIDYLCAQALDFMHDAKIDGASTLHITLIVGLIVHWICALNQLDLTIKARLCDRIIERMRILGGARELRILDVKHIVANITREYTETAQGSPSSREQDLARIIVDSCGAQSHTTIRVVGCDTSRAILTWSVMYDGGSSEAYCKNARGRCIGLEPMDGLRNAARSTGMSQNVLDRLSLFSLSLCANHHDTPKLATAPYDMSIVANLRDLIGATDVAQDDASYNRLIVLATRGCGLTTTERVGAQASVPRASIGFFAFQSFPGETVILARSPPANETARIIGSLTGFARANTSGASLSMRAFNMVTPQNERAMMYAYCILVAKHWGDLGLVIDARVNDATIFTSDGIVCACSAMFGVKSILDGTTIRARSNASQYCHAIAEDNSGTIFERSAMTY